MNWPVVQLGDVVDLQTGWPFKSKSYTADVEAVKLLRGDNIGQGTLKWEGVRRWPANMTHDVTNYWLEENDVVLAMDRPWIEAGLKYAAVTNSDLPCLLVQRVARLRGSKYLRTQYLKYIVGSKSFTDYVLGTQTGTAVPHISGRQIKEFRLSLPPLAVQDAIVEILGPLDDKIDLNRRMSETLEAMARAVFKSWFIDFDPVHAKAAGKAPTHMDAQTAALFPDAFGDDGLPVGWREESLDHIADFLNGLALQKYPAESDEPSLPVIKISELRSGPSAKTGRAALSVPEKYIITDGDVLFSWSGTLMTTLWSYGAGALNQHLFKVTSDRYPKWFYYLWVNHHLPEFQRIAASKATTMGHIQRGHLAAAKVVIPSAPLLSAMSSILQPLIDKQIANSIENQTLAALRDLLLPKLMSGELRLRDGEAILRGVGQ